MGYIHRLMDIRALRGTGRKEPYAYILRHQIQALHGFTPYIDSGRFSRCKGWNNVTDEFRIFCLNQAEHSRTGRGNHRIGPFIGIKIGFDFLTDIVPGKGHIKNTVKPNFLESLPRMDAEMFPSNWA